MLNFRLRFSFLFDKIWRYSSVLNNRAANLILFWKKSILQALIPSCTFINFWIFLAKTFFYTNEKWKSPSCTALFHPARLLTFGILPSCTFIPSCTIIKDTRVQGIDLKALKFPSYYFYKKWILEIDK